ncbi:MAG: heme exporter protein CcmD [Pikeienuella sp.]
MQMVTDMGAHGIYVWPSYAAFAAIFLGMAAWTIVSNRRARTRLAELEARRKAQK